MGAEEDVTGKHLARIQWGDLSGKNYVHYMNAWQSKLITTWLSV